MATESQYLFERNDALKSLWLVSQMPEFDMDTTPTIHFPTLSGEDLSIAKAGYDVVKAENSDFQVVLEQLWLFYLLTPSGLTLIRARGKPIFSFKDSEDIIGTNIRGFAKYSSNKLLAWKILRWSWVPVPREMHLKHSRYYSVPNLVLWGKSPQEFRSASQAIHESTFARVMQFLESNWIEKFVTKPHDGKQWDGVIINQREEFAKNWANKGMFEESDISGILLIQDKIEPYRLINQLTPDVEMRLLCWYRLLPSQYSDWNMRVLVTYDTSNLSSWNYISSGIVCRIDQVDKPVNISLSASYDSFDNVMRKCWLTEEKEVLRKKIEATAIRATEAIVTYCDNKTKRPKDVPDFQVLVWVDIILDRDKNPIVIEVNDMNSGCNYELMKLEGVEALYPIARAILGKASLNRLIERLKSQLLATYWPEWLAKVLSWQAKLDVKEDV